MGLTRWSDVEPILLDALARPPVCREAWVADRCKNDPDLYARAIKLLRADTRGLRALDEPSSRPDQFLDEVQGFSIEEMIGVGGMGVVYRAYDGARHVAIKVLRPEFQSQTEHELRAVSRLNHPNIATLYGTGRTGAGMRYLIFEFVDGVPLSEYCAENALSVAARLDLFCDICGAVEHAHESLVAHRDLKPGNILVTRSGAPKIIDFGIAGDLPDTDGIRESSPFEDACTPVYASPEQRAGEPATRLSDVYSLGVVLFQMLSGKLPHGDARSGMQPAKATTSQEPLPSERAASPDEVREIRGDLDAITVMALQDDPEGRYSSAAALADDIQRHRAHRPVLARPQTSLYRSSRFVMRNRGSLLSGAALCAIGATLVINLLLSKEQLQEEQIRAHAEAARATAAASFVEDLLQSSDPNFNTQAGRTVGDLLDEAEATVSTSFSDDPLARASAMALLARTFRNRGEFDRAIPLFEEALGLYSTGIGRTEQHVAELLLEYGLAFHERDELDAAASTYAEAAAILRETGCTECPKLGSIFNNLGAIAWRRGDTSDAEAHYRTALDIHERAGRADWIDGLRAKANLSLVLRDQGKLQEALTLRHEALHGVRERYGPTHPSVATSLDALASIQKRMGDVKGAEISLREAITLKKEVYGKPHQSTAVSLNNLAVLYEESDRLHEAESLYREAIAL